MRLAPAALAAFAIACSDGESSTKGSDAPDASTMDGGGDAADPTATRTTEIAAGDFVFDAREAGPADGELVLLLHGFPETSFEWRHQLEALGKAGYRAVAPDQRGYSPRARPSDVDDYAIPLLVQDVLTIADALGAERFHVVGHDWGAAVAWATAIFAADRVDSLTAVSVPHPDAFKEVLSDTTSCQYQASFYFDLFVLPNSEDAFLANDAAQLRGFYSELPPEAVDEYVAALGTKEALGAALNWYRANIENRAPKGPMVGPVSVPTLFIWSDGDTALCRDGAELTADYVDGPYQFEIIEDVSHWVPELAPEEVSTLLVAHVDAY